MTRATVAVLYASEYLFPSDKARTTIPNVVNSYAFVRCAPINTYCKGMQALNAIVCRMSGCPFCFFSPQSRVSGTHRTARKNALSPLNDSPINVMLWLILITPLIIAHLLFTTENVNECRAISLPMERVSTRSSQMPPFSSCYLFIPFLYLPNTVCSGPENSLHPKKKRKYPVHL